MAVVSRFRPSEKQEARSEADEGDASPPYERLQIALPADAYHRVPQRRRLVWTSGAWIVGHRRQDAVEERAEGDVSDEDVVVDPWAVRSE